MNNVKNKRFYKVISLFIKAIVLAASFYYVIHKLTIAPSLLALAPLQLSSRSICYLVLTIAFMFCNWGLEARKWQLLISSYEKISWIQSLQSILAGITIGIFTPNRIGEFTGRIFFLRETDKITASLRSIFGSFVQLLITTLTGCIAIVFYVQKNYNNHVPLQSFLDPEKKWNLIILSLLLIILILAVLRLPFFSKWKQRLSPFFKIPPAVFFQTFFLSALRYLVFTTQFYLILIALGMEIEFTSAFLLIAVTFLITSVIPTFALTEIVVRSAVAVSVFAVIDTVHPEIAAAASFLLWIINLAIPALLGSLFMGKLQFFKA